VFIIIIIIIIQHFFKKNQIVRSEHAKALRLASGAHMIPHPEKRHKV
jgi:hypothetical protein